MLDELQRRNYSQRTAEAYLRAMKAFAKHFHRAPDQLNQDHLREYQAYLFRERKLSSRHSYATHQLEAGADLVSVQNLLGHADVRDTMIYLHLSKRHLQCAPNPLDALELGTPAFTKRAQRLLK